MGLSDLWLLVARLLRKRGPGRRPPGDLICRQTVQRERDLQFKTAARRQGGRWPVQQAKSKTGPGGGDACFPCGEGARPGVVVGTEGARHGFFNYGRGDNSDYRATLTATDAFFVSLGWLRSK